jgi:hypothetical protein
MGIRRALGIAGKVGAGLAGVQLPPDHRIADALEHIADILERIAPQKPSFSSPHMKHPPLGITTADNDTMVAIEMEEEAEVKSREEKLMKEYGDYVKWREQNVTQGKKE